MDILDSRFFTVDIRSIECDVAFDDPEDGTWLSAGLSSGNSLSAYLADFSEDTLRAHSVDESEFTATLSSPEIASIGLDLGNGVGLDLGGEVGLLISEAPSIPDEIFSLYSWANLGSGGYNQLTWEDLSTSGSNPLSWSDMES